MQYREAAVRVSQTVVSISRELSSSMAHMFQYEKEGKVSREESAAYYRVIRDTLDKLLIFVLDPIYEIHPELRPQCCLCENQNESDEGGEISLIQDNEYPPPL